MWESGFSMLTRPFLSKCLVNLQAGADSVLPVAITRRFSGPRHHILSTTPTFSFQAEMQPFLMQSATATSGFRTSAASWAQLTARTSAALHQH
jgi:hypothetical protein